jgi:hypothetical protein
MPSGNPGFAWMQIFTAAPLFEQGCQIFIDPGMPKREKRYEMNTNYTKRQ